MEDKKRSWAVMVAACVLLQACSIGIYNKDRPYDPNFKQGETLHDQIPNWEGEALRKRACGKPAQDRVSWERDIDC